MDREVSDLDRVPRTRLTSDGASPKERKLQKQDISPLRYMLNFFAVSAVPRQVC